MVASLLCTLALGCPSVPAAAQRPELSLGQPLANALAAYRPLGINVVSSSRLVSRRHRVSRLPDPLLPLVEQIRDLLSPHDFRLKKLNEHTWYVVQGAASTPQEKPPKPVEPDEEFTPVIEEIVVTGSYRLTVFLPPPNA